MSRATPDLVVLDLMLPDIAGEEVARSLRAVSDIPIIMLTAKAAEMLTAKAAEEDRVVGLRLGADDYLVKPFSPRELVARVEAVLRRARGGQADAELSFGGAELVIDREAREVRVRGREVVLTRSEFDLLHAPPALAGSTHATSSSPGCRATTSRATSEPSTPTSRTSGRSWGTIPGNPGTSSR